MTGRAVTGRPLSIHEPFTQLIANITNVLCLHDGASTRQGGRLLQEALQTLIISALIDADGQASDLTLTQDAVLQRALQFIDENHTDPTMSAAVVAQTVSVSRGYLYRLFALIGSTPRLELERRRLATAERLLDNRPRGAPVMIDEIAMNAGFSSGRQLRSVRARIAQSP